MHTAAAVWNLLCLLVLLAVYAGVAYIQLTAGERWLRSKPGVWPLARAGLSLLHAVFAYYLLVGVVVILNVLVTGNYRQMAFGPDALPIFLAAFLFSLPMACVPTPPPQSSTSRGRSPSRPRSRRSSTSACQRTD